MGCQVRGLVSFFLPSIVRPLLKVKFLPHSVYFLSFASVGRHTPGRCKTPPRNCQSRKMSRNQHPVTQAAHPNADSSCQPRRNFIRQGNCDWKLNLPHPASIWGLQGKYYENGVVRSTATANVKSGRDCLAGFVGRHGAMRISRKHPGLMPGGWWARG